METTINGKQLSAAARRFPAIAHSRAPHRLNRFPSAAPRVPCRLASKKSNYQDLGSYVKPSRLLPVNEQRLSTDVSLDKLFSYIDQNQSKYTVKLRTSNLYGSALSDTNAGVLVCLIDENGNSILHRLSAYEEVVHTKQSEPDKVSEVIHFQRGSVDEFTFYGPKLGKIIAVWIGVESGQWRLGGVNLVVIYGRQPTDEEGEVDNFVGIRYDFEAEEFLLGEGSENSMVELRPSLMTALSNSDLRASSTTELAQSVSLQSKEESMQAYADLKLSLILYDSILIFTGTAIANLSSGEEAAFSFLFGGVSGFLYLLLLQRSVDGLPSPASASPETKGNFEHMFEGFRSPVSGLALAVGATVLALKYGSNDPQISLTAKDLIVGLIGFLTCKVAVLLAAFKPMPVSWNK